MLVDFTVQNYGPFRDEVALYLIASSEVDEHILPIPSDIFSVGLLKATVIFGPNGSGKSCLLDAIRSLKVLTSCARVDDVLLPGYNPFCYAERSPEMPVSMEIRMVLGGILYDYSISYTSSGIQGESLHYYQDGHNIPVFVRGDESGPIDEAILRHVTDTSSYLFVAAIFNDKVCNTVLYGIQGIEVISKRDMFDPERTYRMAEKDPEIKRMLISALDAADLDISDYRGKLMIIGDEDEQTLVDLRIIHNPRDTDGNTVETGFPIQCESDGIITMFSMMGPVCSVLMKGGTVIIDDLGTNLHPMVSRWLIGLFNSSENDNGAQLVVTTHDMELMDIDDLLRRDQIWFTKKDRGSGSSSLYSLADFIDVGKGSDVRTDYLMGRFDAIPTVVGVKRL